MDDPRLCARRRGASRGGLHPALVPEAVKNAALYLLKDAKGEEPAAALLGICALGREVFAAANGDPAGKRPGGGRA